uniref:Phage tail collar domain-containing protein n=1 Tax=viral metagenome TaxID=1070528 RepID=A0A6C0I3W6_9ZZZZ
MSIPTNNYLYKNLYPFSNTGTIAAYLGVTDPSSGWIICNGIQRTNGTDGRYNTLLNLGIGSGSQNGNYTPPNLSAAFLRGAGSQTYNSVTYNGSATINTFQGHAIQQHTHTLTDPGHTHTQQPHSHTITKTSDGYTNKQYYQAQGGGRIICNAFNYTDTFSSFLSNFGYSMNATTATNQTSTTQISIGDISNVIINNIDTDETYPFNFSVNWIIQL